MKTKYNVLVFLYTKTQYQWIEVSGPDVSEIADPSGIAEAISSLTKIHVDDFTIVSIIKGNPNLVYQS